MCCLVGFVIALYIFHCRTLMKKPLRNFLLPSGFTNRRNCSIPSEELSELKLIKTHLRSPIQRERLYSLAIKSIETKISRDINLNKILNDISNAKARKKSLSEQIYFL